MLHDDYLCLEEFNKQQIKEAEAKFNRKTRKQRQLLSESGFVLSIAPPPLSRDKRMKMKKSINHLKRAKTINSTLLTLLVLFRIYTSHSHDPNKSKKKEYVLDKIKT